MFPSPRREGQWCFTEVLALFLFSATSEDTTNGSLRFVLSPPNFHQSSVLFRTQESQEYELPHLVRHAAIAEALSQLGIEVVVGVASVGSLGPSHPPGKAVVPSDYFSPWHVTSGLSNEAAHISPQYDPLLRATLLRATGADQAESPCVYVQTHGPRFETAAEVCLLDSALSLLSLFLSFTGALVGALPGTVGSCGWHDRSI